MTTPNWMHNSGKDKKTKGTCKSVLKSRKQSLRSLKLKLSTSHVTVDKVAQGS